MPDLLHRRAFLRSSAGVGLAAYMVEAALQSPDTVRSGALPPAAVPGRPLVGRSAWINFEFAITWERVNLLQEIVTGLVGRGVGDVTLLISSSGGDVAAAISTYHFLRSVGIRLTTYNIGNTYSSAVVLFLAGDRRVTEMATQFVIHPPGIMGGASMTAQDLEQKVQALDQDTSRLREIFLARTHMTKDEADAMLRKVTFIDGRRALELGIVTELGHLDRQAGAPLLTLPTSTLHAPPSAPAPANPTAPNVPPTPAAN